MMDECIAAVASILALHGWTLLLITAAALVAYLVTLHYIPAAAQTLFSRNLYGIDMNKTTATERAEFATLRATQGHDGIARDARFAARAIPESLGILAGAVFLCVLTLLIVLLEGRDTHTMAGAITTITVMLLLGFVDDVLDVRWRHKIFLSALGSLAFILAYRGSLYVLVPPALTRAALTLAGMDVRDAEAMWSLRSATSFSSSSLSAASGELPIYAMWMEEINSFLQDPFAWLLQHNCIAPSGSGTSSITLVLYLGPLYLLYQMLLCIFCTNSINILAGINGLEVGQSLVIAAASVLHNLVQLRPQDHATTASSSPTTDAPLRALMLLGPFMGVSAALWRYNRYPATIFVGDSFTYFAGTVLAVAAITGVYGKTLMLFFVPQLINFIISLPQLFGLVVCPRHRVPTWVKERDVLHNSGNYTLLNAILLVTGDLTEKQLTRVVLGLQIITCAMGFVLRYLVASFLYDHVE